MSRKIIENLEFICQRIDCYFPRIVVNNSQTKSFTSSPFNRNWALNIQMEFYWYLFGLTFLEWFKRHWFINIMWLIWHCSQRNFEGLKLGRPKVELFLLMLKIRFFRTQADLACQKSTELKAQFFLSWRVLETLDLELMYIFGFLTRG